MPTKVHMGHSTLIGGVCGRGSKHGDADICVSQETFFREIAKRHRCHYCVREVYIVGSGPEHDPTSWDDPRDKLEIHLDPEGN